MECVSPDGRFKAIMDIAYEIRMGAPTAGTLLITDSADKGRVLVRVESCNPSVVWAADSNALAVPQWTPELMQRLCIVSMSTRTVRKFDDPFSVLELHSFADGVVRGIDSPIHHPRQITVRVGNAGEAI